MYFSLYAVWYISFKSELYQIHGAVEIIQQTMIIKIPYVV